VKWSGDTLGDFWFSFVTRTQDLLVLHPDPNKEYWDWYEYGQGTATVVPWVLPTSPTSPDPSVLRDFHRRLRQEAIIHAQGHWPRREVGMVLCSVLATRVWGRCPTRCGLVVAVVCAAGWAIVSMGTSPQYADSEPSARLLQSIRVRDLQAYTRRCGI